MCLPFLWLKDGVRLKNTQDRVEPPDLNLKEVSYRCDTDTEHIYVKKGYSNYHVSIFLLFLCTYGQKHIKPKTLWRRCSTRLASCGGLAHPVAGGKESLRNCHFSRMHSSLMWAEEYHYKKLNSIFNVGTHHVTTFSTGCSFQNFRTYLIFYWPKPHFCFLHSFMWIKIENSYALVEYRFSKVVDSCSI